MLYLTNRFNTSNNVLNVNSLKPTRGCATSQNSWSGFLGIVEKKLKLRNSQKDVLYSTRRNPKSLK